MNPNFPHEKAIMRICRYLFGTKDRGIIFKPDKKQGLELFVDAEFAGNWKNADEDHPENFLSRSGFTIKFNNCCILWKSSLQTEITLSTAESEYVALSQGLCLVLPIINLLKEFQVIFNEISLPQPKVHCKVYEDNAACIKMAQSEKIYSKN